MQNIFSQYVHMHLDQITMQYSQYLFDFEAHQVQEFSNHILHPRFLLYLLIISQDTQQFY
jgi:hypothetical protein